MVYTAWCTIMAFSVVSLGLLLLPAFCFGADFGYDGENGPENWGGVCNTGKQQSPINIETCKAKSVCLPPLKFDNFNVTYLTSMVNNGHSVQMQSNGSKDATITGGPLEKGEVYKFAQMHCHWGRNNSEGSENTVNGRSFPMECHFVFYNTKYESIDKAINYPDGLVVVAIFYVVGNKPNPNYEPMITKISKIENATMETNLSEKMSVGSSLPNRMDMQCYYTFSGSLTTPPCSEAVTWIVVEKPLQMSDEQVASFRTIRDSEGNKLTHNFRPTQPLNKREVRQNCPKRRNLFDGNSGQLNYVIEPLLFWSTILQCLYG